MPEMEKALLVLRTTRRAGRDQKCVPLGKLGISPLDFWLVVAGAGDGALGIGDDDLEWRAADVLEGPGEGSPARFPRVGW